MAWWKMNSAVPLEREKFMQIVYGFVFNCPSCISRSIPDGINSAGKKKRKIIYEPVSARNNTFRSKGITDSLLNTLLAQIRKPIALMGTYSVLKQAGNVEATIENIKLTASLSDEAYDVLVYKEHSNMSNPEAIFYYIRNAFAHGSFEVVNINGKYVYYLESKKGDEVKAQMRLKESTLERYLTYCSLPAGEIKKLQKHKK